MFDDIEVVVFDVLGTLVDEGAGLRAGLQAAAPDAAASEVVAMQESWQRYVADRQREMAAGRAEYVDSEVLDAEAADHVARQHGIDSSADLRTLATTSRRLPSWDDSAAGVAAIAGSRTMIALSNAADVTLLHLHAHAGFRWHNVVSSEQVRRYKPDPAVYRRALEVAGHSPSHVLMVAAHAWDLRAAQAEGMRTAFVARPVADPPVPSDAFDAAFDDLIGLAATLRR